MLVFMSFSYSASESSSPGRGRLFTPTDGVDACDELEGAVRVVKIFASSSFSSLPGAGNRVPDVLNPNCPFELPLFWLSVLPLIPNAFRSLLLRGPAAPFPLSKSFAPSCRCDSDR